MESSKEECKIVLEVSNEIANKIGGIYTVIASKAPEMQRMLGPGNYIAIGLYNSFKARKDFEELEIPNELEKTFAAVRAEGIDVKYGRWLGGGGVETILVDPSYLLDVPLVTGKLKRRIDEIKGTLWNWFNIDSLWMSEVFDPMVAFGWASGVLIQHLMDNPRFKDNNVVAHFHEWIAGSGLLYLKKMKVNIATVFMTHATQLGRNIAMGPEDINNILDELLENNETIPPQKAYQYHVEGTHQLEVICSENADSLITVSEAVAREAEAILGKRPDFIIPNGINFDTLALMDELHSKHLEARAKINHFIEAYFNPYYSLEIENLLIIHISGRYEYHNKGIDVFIEALDILNKQIVENSNQRDIVAFIWIPAPVSGIRPSIVESFKVAREQRQLIQAPMMRIEEWLSFNTANYRNHLTDKKLLDFFSDEEIEKISTISKKSKIDSLKEPNPPICPFKLNEKDTIYQTLLNLNLTNEQKDRVKVIFYPVYLSRDDTLLDLNYYDAVAGCDMGIYPSTYEPYGLTPLEALALGVPAVTTDLSGFGFLVNEQTRKDNYGIFVLKRRNRTNTEAAQDLAEIILNQSKLSEEKTQNARLEARKISELYSWQNIIKEYKIAYDKAFRKYRNR